jgi:hypothetical protein
MEGESDNVDERIEQELADIQNEREVLSENIEGDVYAIAVDAVASNLEKLADVIQNAAKSLILNTRKLPVGYIILLQSTMCT